MKELMKLFFTVFVLGLACIKAPANATQENGVHAERGDSLVVAVFADPDSLNPLTFVTADPSMVLMNRIAPYLTDSEFQCELRYRPMLAERWEWNENSKELTYYLRRDMKWEDGQPITAEDGIFSFGLISNPKVASPRADILNKLIPEKGCEKIDDYTLRFTFRDSFDPITRLAVTSEWGWLPAHACKDLKPEQIRSHPISRKPLSGNGFRLDRWTPGQEVVLVRNDNPPFGEPAYLDKLIFRIIPDYNTCLTELLSGRVDLFYSLLPQDYPRVATNPELSLIPRGYRWLDLVVWNFKNPLFQNQKVRQALALAVDYDKLIDGLLSAGGKRYGKRAVSQMTPEICRLSNLEIDPLPYDPERAKKILAEEGWQDLDGDGILEKEGKKFTFTLLTYSTSVRLINAAQVVQDQWKKIGVEAKIEKRDFNHASESLRKKEFEAALISWQSELWPDPSATLRSGEAYPNNYGSYSNPRVESLLDRAMREPDPEKNRLLWKELQSLVYEEQPMLFLYWRDMPIAIHKRFRDVRSDITSPMQEVERWWVALKEQKYQKPK